MLGGKIFKIPNFNSNTTNNKTKVIGEKGEGAINILLNCATILTEKKQQTYDR